MKVAFFAEVLEKDIDGACRTMFQLIDRIDSSLFEFLFVCSTGPATIQGFECVHVPAVTLPVNTSYKMALPGLAQQHLCDRLQAFQPEVIHIATPSLLGNFAMKYALKQHIPVLSIYHTYFISYIDYYLKHIPFLIHSVKQTVTEGQRVFYNQCSLIYVPSETMQTELLNMGVQQCKMKLWQRDIDSTLFSPEKNVLAGMEEQDAQQNWRELANTYFNDLLFLARSQPKVNTSKPLYYEAS
ncbi:Glycosyltransferase Family 4 [Filimonas lacunae]|uniref:Glycosyltransferase Family 4 n=2 Tax=Filimonas lacunae TaxID=477680 RepID=A0A173MNI5_9BACT|nr:glycosyl transferase, group 1 [Filimonas lacunae]SIS64332.1 Glycosyltransferase Family 4 [Filimonas lacunae]